MGIAANGWDDPGIPGEPATPAGPSPEVIGFAAAVDQLLAGVERIDALPVDVLAATIVRLDSVRAQLDAYFSATVAAFDGRAGALTLTGARTTGTWLAAATRMNAADAHAVVRVGRRCFGGAGRRPSLPNTGAALMAGHITAGHAREVTNAVRDLPELLYPEAEKGLLTAAAVLDPAGLRRITADVRHQLLPAAVTVDDATRRAGREFWWVSTFNGMVTGGFSLTPEAEAFLASALDGRAAASSADDERSLGQRRADAFLELLAAAGPGGSSGEFTLPEVVITIPADTLSGQPGAPAARIGLATDTGYGDATPISAQTARRLCCEAIVTWLALNPRDRALAMGSARRTAPRRLRRAIEARDRRCRFQGCQVPAQRCQVHHIVHWADCHSTDFDNCILLCWHHHDLVHHEGWTISGRANGELGFLPPSPGFRRLPRRGQRPRAPVRR